MWVDEKMEGRVDGGWTGVGRGRNRMQTRHHEASKYGGRDCDMRYEVSGCGGVVGKLDPGCEAGHPNGKAQRTDKEAVLGLKTREDTRST